MKWLKIIIALAEMFLPFWSRAGKNKLADELEIAQGALKALTGNMTPEEKARVITDAVLNLKDVKAFKERATNKLYKARDRLAKKFL